jgi:uncharacterized protein (TIGR03086 family)
VSDNLRQYTTIMFGFEHVLRLVPPDAWDNPSPCEGWSARQVAGHAMAVVNNIAARGGVGTRVDAFADLDELAGRDPLATFRAIRERFLEATDQAGALQTPVESSLGPMTLDEFIGRMRSDTLVHTWDLARATGVDEALDPGAVSAVYADYLSGVNEAPRVPGRYAEAIEADPDASEQDRMIAFTGRDPRR